MKYVTTWMSGAKRLYKDSQHSWGVPLETGTYFAVQRGRKKATLKIFISCGLSFYKAAMCVRGVEL